MNIPKQLGDITRYDHIDDEIVVSDKGASFTVEGVTRMQIGFYLQQSKVINLIQINNDCVHLFLQFTDFYCFHLILTYVHPW